MKQNIYRIDLYAHFPKENEPYCWFISVHRKTKSHHYGPVSIKFVDTVLSKCVTWEHTILSDLSDDNNPKIALTVELRNNQL